METKGSRRAGQQMEIKFGGGSFCAVHSVVWKPLIRKNICRETSQKLQITKPVPTKYNMKCKIDFAWPQFMRRDIESPLDRKN